MPVKGFNYQEFAQSMVQQASAAVPPEIDEQYKNFLLNVIYDFAIKAGEALVSEENSLLTPENVQVIIQYIGEWIFHKGIELIHSSIPPDYWLRILQTIAGGIFEAGKNAFIAGNLDEGTVRTLIEGEVHSHYTHALNQLKAEGVLNDDMIHSVQQAQVQAQKQISQSMPQQPPQPDQEPVQEHPEASQVNEKEAKLATIAVIISSLPSEKSASILASFSAADAEKIKYYMQPENMNLQIDPQMTSSLLMSLKNMIMPEEAPTQVAKNIQRLSQNVDPAKMIAILIKERPVVQNYVKSCIEGKFIRRDFSPYLARVIYKHLEKQLSMA